jgi:hypothetical protein
VRRRRHERLAAERPYRGRDALVIGGHQHAVDVRAPGALVDVLDHRFSEEVAERLAREATGRVARGDDGDY